MGLGARVGKGFQAALSAWTEAEVGKQRASVRSSVVFCLAVGKGAWREWREIRLQGLECRAKWGREQAGLVVSLFTGSWESF